MTLDLVTLMLANSLVASASAVLLLVVWLGDRKAASALLWAFGSVCLAAGIALLALAAQPPTRLVAILCTVLFCGADSLLLMGALAFEGRKPIPVGLIAGNVTSLLLTVAAMLGYAPILTTALAQALPCLFIYGAAYTLWSGRHEPLKARLPAVAFMTVHATLVALIVPASLQASRSMPQHSPLSLFGVIHFETVVYLMAITVLMTSMLRERKEAAERAKSVQDHLTGLLNRRGFLTKAESALATSVASELPASLLMFDLDHFKRVNDTFGHLVGDEVLVVFGGVLRKTLRQTDVLGRLGGEEFAAVLPGTSVACAAALAERVRVNFAEAAEVVQGRPVHGTVTAGVAAVEAGPADLTVLLRSADEALYSAKAFGRNRVQTAHRGPATPSKIVRIA